VTFESLERRANQIARSLGERAAVGGIVAIVLPNCLDHILTTLATWKIGATVLPLRDDLPDWELGRLLRLAQPRVVVAEGRGKSGFVTPADLEATTDRPDTALPDRIAECAQMVASSGSTGSPKLIVTPTRAVLAGDAQSSALSSSAQQTILVVSPLYHVNGFAFAAPRCSKATGSSSWSASTRRTPSSSSSSTTSPTRSWCRRCCSASLVYPTSAPIGSRASSVSSTAAPRSPNGWSTRGRRVPGDAACVPGQPAPP